MRLFQKSRVLGVLILGQMRHDDQQGMNGMTWWSVDLHLVSQLFSRLLSPFKPQAYCAQPCTSSMIKNHIPRIPRFYLYLKIRVILKYQLGIEKLTVLLGILKVVIQIIL